MLSAVVFVALLGFGAAQRPRQPAGNSPAAYREITSCPETYGLQLYPHPASCHDFYKCTNGSLTLETCENGLLFDGKGAVHNYCNYHWGVNCENRLFELTPIARGVCEYAFGLFSAGPCEKYFTQCEYGEPIDLPCTTGLAYDDRIHGCNWPDLLEYCNPDEVVGFKCPAYAEPGSLSAKFSPFPRYPSGDCSSYIVCVEGYPRLIGCGEYTVFDEATLSCQDPEYVPACANYFK